MVLFISEKVPGTDDNWYFTDHSGISAFGGQSVHIRADRRSGHKRWKYDRLMPFIGCLIGVTIVMGVLRFLFQVAFETASQGVLYDMRDKVYRKLLEEDFAFYNKKRTGDLMSRQTGDMDAIRHFVAYVVYMVYQSVLMFVFALLMIFTVNTKLALAMLVVLPFTAFATCRQTKEVRPAFKRNRDCFPHSMRLCRKMSVETVW